MTPSGLDPDLAAVLTAWARMHEPSTAARMAEIARRFTRRLERAGVKSYVDVTSDDVHGFVVATTRAGTPPAPATRAFRRSTVRALYRQLRALGHTVGDPTLDIVVVRGARRFARPLTNDEIRLSRAVATATTRVTAGPPRRAVAWAFAETGATTAEIPQITIADLDDPLHPTRVRLPGSRTVAARTVKLTGWAQATIAGHLAHHHYLPGQMITFRGTRAKTGSNSALSSTCQQIVEILHAAGITSDPTVRPASVRHWAARNAYDNGATLTDTALLLGLNSLDTTAARIGLDWTTSTPGADQR